MSVIRSPSLGDVISLCLLNEVSSFQYTCCPLALFLSPSIAHSSLLAYSTQPLWPPSSNQTKSYPRAFVHTHPPSFLNQD